MAVNLTLSLRPLGEKKSQGLKSGWSLSPRSVADFTCDFEPEDLCGFEVTSTTSYLKFRQHAGEQAADANLPPTDNAGSETAKYLEADFRLDEDGGGTDKVVTASIYKNGFSGTEDQFVCMSFWYAHNVSI